MDSLIVSNSASTEQSHSHDLEFYTEYKPDTSGKKLSLSLDYFNYKHESDRRYDSDRRSADGVITPGSASSGNNLGSRKLQNYVAKVDVEYPFKAFKLGFGGQLSTSNTDDDLHFYDLSNGAQKSDDGQRNHFEYRENTQALYLSASRSLGSKWQAKLGLRLENTQIRGFSHQLNHTDTKAYSRLFPTAYLSYQADTDNTLSLNYSRRVRRPSYEFLNPFRIIENQYSHVEGNPLLQPSYTDKVAFSFTHKNHWINTLHYSRLVSDFQQIMTTDSRTKVRKLMPENYLNTNTLGLDVSYTLSPWSWWETINVMTVSYATNEATFPNVQVNRWQLAAYASTNHTLSLNRSKTVVLNVNFWLQFPTKGDLYDMKPYDELDLALKWSLLHRKLQLALYAQDVFSSNPPLWIAYTNDIRQEYRSYHDYRRFRIAFSYRFGNDKVKVKKRDFANKTESHRVSD